MPRRRSIHSLAAVAAALAAAVCLLPASASAAPSVGDYTCSSFSLESWIDVPSVNSSDVGSEPVSLTGQADCVAGGTRYASTSFAFNGTLTLNCASSTLAFDGTFTLNDGVHGALNTSGTISLSGTSSGAPGTVTLASGQRGAATDTVIRYILRPSDFCSASDATEPIDLTLRGAFGSTSPGTL